MTIYNILIPEVHYSHRRVEADTEKEAIELAWEAECNFIEYSHTLDPQFIKVEVVKDKDI